MLIVSKPIQLTFITNHPIEEYVFQIHYENLNRAIIVRTVTAESHALDSGHGFSSNVFVDLYNIREQDISKYTVKPFINDPIDGAVDEKKQLIHIIVCEKYDTKEDEVNEEEAQGKDFLLESQLSTDKE